MNEEHLMDFIIEIKASLSSIDTKVDGILDQIKNHENRICELERSLQRSSGAIDQKFLGKCLLISLAIIASLTGAGSLIAKFFCN